jgi:hypothetical protein
MTSLNILTRGRKTLTSADKIRRKKSYKLRILYDGPLGIQNSSTNGIKVAICDHCLVGVLEIKAFDFISKLEARAIYIDRSKIYTCCITEGAIKESSDFETSDRRKSVGFFGFGSQHGHLFGFSKRNINTSESDESSGDDDVINGSRSISKEKIKAMAVQKILSRLRVTDRTTHSLELSIDLSADSESGACPIVEREIPAKLIPASTSWSTNGTSLK